MFQLRKGKSLIAEVPTASRQLGDGLEYRLVFDRDYLAQSTFEFSGLEGRYKVDLAHWCQCNDLFSASFRFLKSEVAQGDTARVAIEIVAHDDTRLTFPTTCQLEYEIRDSSGNIVGVGPDVACGDAYTSTDFEKDQRNEISLPVFTARPAEVGGSDIAALRPGKYRVKCWVIGYATLGLEGELDLTVRPR